MDIQDVSVFLPYYLQHRNAQPGMNLWTQGKGFSRAAALTSSSGGCYVKQDRLCESTDNQQKPALKKDYHEPKFRFFPLVFKDQFTFFCFSKTVVALRKTAQFRQKPQPVLKSSCFRDQIPCSVPSQEFQDCISTFSGRVNCKDCCFIKIQSSRLSLSHSQDTYLKKENFSTQINSILKTDCIIHTR